MSVFESMTPSERALRARTAVHTSWANTVGAKDRRRRTAPGTAAFLARFERQVDPEGLMDPADRAKAAENAKSAYFAGLALKAAKAKRLKRQQSKP